jgi:transcriptional regulator with XRE-family HTH domain
METRGQLILTARVGRGLDLDTIAALVPCTRNYLYRLERGIKGGSARTLARLEDVLGLQPGSLARAPVADLPAP